MKYVKKNKPNYFGRPTWSANELIWLIVYYPDKSNESLAKKLGKKVDAVHNQGHVLGLKKSAKYLSSIPGKKFFEASKKNRFKKGQISHNKGKTWDEFMSKEGQKGSLKTTFKKGNQPHNTKKDNEITVRRDKSGWNYKYIRISESLWEPLHIYNYKKKHGKIPKGKIVVFKDRYHPDREKVSNLELITREENMNRNTIHRYPEDLKITIRALGKLKRTIKKRTNGTEQIEAPERSPVRGDRKLKQSRRRK